MSTRDKQYQLDDNVEADEGSITSVDTKKNKDKEDKTKRGRGNQKKSTVMELAKTIYDSHIIILNNMDDDIDVFHSDKLRLQLGIVAYHFGETGAYWIGNNILFDHAVAEQKG